MAKYWVVRVTTEEDGKIMGMVDHSVDTRAHAREFMAGTKLIHKRSPEVKVELYKVKSVPMGEHETVFMTKAR